MNDLFLKCLSLRADRKLQLAVCVQGHRARRHTAALKWKTGIRFAECWKYQVTDPERRRSHIFCCLTFGRISTLGNCQALTDVAIETLAVSTSQCLHDLQ